MTFITVGSFTHWLKSVSDSNHCQHKSAKGLDLFWTRGRSGEILIVCNSNARDLLRPEYGSGIWIFPKFLKNSKFGECKRHCFISVVEKVIISILTHNASFPAVTSCDKQHHVIIRLSPIRVTISQTGVSSFFSEINWLKKLSLEGLKKRLEKFFKLEEMKLTLRLTWKARWKADFLPRPRKLR